MTTKREKFPVTRPIQNRSVLLWDERGLFIGIGYSTLCKETGIAITAGGKKYDSNDVLYWIYK